MNADGRYEASRPKTSEEEVEEDVTKVRITQERADSRSTTHPGPIPNSANLLPSCSKHPSPIPRVDNQSHSSHLVVGNNYVSMRK